jgi:hypothetical protein
MLDVLPPHEPLDYRQIGGRLPQRARGREAAACRSASLLKDASPHGESSPEWAASTSLAS